LLLIQGIYPIVDPTLRTDISGVELARRIVDARPKQVQLRLKEQPDREFLSLAETVREITNNLGVLMIINDRVDIAWACGADGVHLGQDDLPPEAARSMLRQGKIVGISTSSLPEAETAVSRGVDYIAFGPVFETATKKSSARSARGLDALREVVERIPLPVVAIGGIHQGNIVSVAQTGVAGIAVVSGIVMASDITGAVRKLQEAFVDNPGSQTGVRI